MKAIIYVKDGECVARIRTKSKPTLQAGDEFAIATGLDGEFAQWQLADLAEHLQNNYRLSRAKP